MLLSIPRRRNLKVHANLFAKDLAYGTVEIGASCFTFGIYLLSRVGCVVALIANNDRCLLNSECLSCCALGCSFDGGEHNKVEKHHWNVFMLPTTTLAENLLFILTGF